MAFSLIVSLLQLIAQFRIFPSSGSRYSFVANYTSAVIFELILVLICCMIIPLFVCESKYLNVIYLVKIITIFPMTHFMKVSSPEMEDILTWQLYRYTVKLGGQKDKDKEALFNVAYNVTDNISS